MTSVGTKYIYCLDKFTFTTWNYSFTWIVVNRKSEESFRVIINEYITWRSKQRIKKHGKAEAKNFENANLLFTDFRGFIQISEKLNPVEVVTFFDSSFKAFDKIIARYNIEKIKTIGDSYMCVGGLPVPDRNSAIAVLYAALEFQAFIPIRQM